MYIVYIWLSYVRKNILFLLKQRQIWHILTHSTVFLVKTEANMTHFTVFLVKTKANMTNFTVFLVKTKTNMTHFTVFLKVPFSWHCAMVVLFCITVNITPRLLCKQIVHLLYQERQLCKQILHLLYQERQLCIMYHSSDSKLLVISKLPLIIAQ